MKWIARDTRCAGEGLESPKDPAKERVEEVCNEEEGERGKHRGPPGIQHCVQAHADKLRSAVGRWVGQAWYACGF